MMGLDWMGWGGQQRDPGHPYVTHRLLSNSYVGLFVLPTYLPPYGSCRPGHSYVTLRL